MANRFCRSLTLRSFDRCPTLPRTDEVALRSRDRAQRREKVFVTGAQEIEATMMQRGDVRRGARKMRASPIE
jgi:hypothetical protein